MPEHRRQINDVSGRGEERLFFSIGNENLWLERERERERDRERERE